MNNFRDNLHSAFYFPGSNGESYHENLDQNNNPDYQVSKEDFVMSGTQYDAALEEAVLNVDNTEAETTQWVYEVKSMLVWDVAKDILDNMKYPEGYAARFEADKNRFVNRITSMPEWSSEMYDQKWNKAIDAGYQNLISILEKGGYFADCVDDAAKQVKLSQVKQKYDEEVKQQYIDNVWSANNGKFNKVKDNLFDYTKAESPSWKVYVDLLKETEKQGKKASKKQDVVTEGDNTDENEKGQENSVKAENSRMNTGSLASETVEQKVEDKELDKLFKQLAKNKKIDFPWTNNEWKCSKAEKKLAISSAKVFLQLLDAWTMQSMVDKCKTYEWKELSASDAKNWKQDLNINSDVKDIQAFYESYQEYQNANTEYQHLKGFMWFFFEKGIDDREGLKTSLEKDQSKKITNSEISKMGNRLYRWIDSNGTYVDAYTGNEVNRRPSDWKQRASYEVIKTRLQEEKNNQPGLDKMLTLLWDYNLDGEVNSGDNGSKTWSQLSDIFRRTVATVAIENPDFDSNDAVENLVSYANKFGLNLPKNISSVDELYWWMTKWPEWYENTRKLQNFIKNLQIDLWDVLKNWEWAWEESLKNATSSLKMEQQEKEETEKAAKEKTDEIVKQEEEKLKEIIKDESERTNLMQQLVSQLPWMLVDEALKEQQRMLALWVAVPLNKIIRWCSAWFHVWIDSNGKPTFGLFIWWDVKVNLWKSADLSAAVNAGAKLLFIPCAAAWLELWFDANKKNREQSLDAKWLARVSLWWNVATYGWIFSRWVSAWYEQNKLVGIEKQAVNIKNQINKMMSDKESGLLKDPNNLNEDAVKQWLKEKFPKSSDEELDGAAKNLMFIITQFKIDEQTTQEDMDIYAQVISDCFSEQWRSAALAGVETKKWKLTGWKVWVQFFAWYIPALSVVARFTKYYNARTEESERSASHRIDAAVNGKWNRNVDMKDSKEVWENHINQINKALENYWAPENSLRYITWIDWKPGRICVPVSLVKWTGINVRISEEMKWCVKVEADWFSFPANAVYRLFQETWWNLKSVTLNIGSDKNNESDISLLNMSSESEWIGDKELMWEKKRATEEPVNVSEGLEYKKSYGELFTEDVVESLKTVDSADRKKFSEFMKNKRDAQANFQNTISALKDVLWENQKFSKIVEALDDDAISNADKQLIVDRVMAISAYANVHDKWWLNANIEQRKDYYKKDTMKWPNGQAIFDKIDVDRAALVNQIHEDGNYESEIQTNLLWATAFYHKNNTEKGLAMTWLGATSVLWWQMQEISGEDRTKVENWFLWENGETYTPWVLDKSKSPAEWANLKKAVSDYMKEQGVDCKLTDDQLKDLLKWENVELSLDNWQENVIVNMDVKYMFYLMWECANESVGMQLWKLWIMRQVDDYRKWALYLNEAEDRGSVKMGRKDFAAGISFGVEWNRKTQWSMPGDGKTWWEDPDYTPNLDF